MLDTMTRTSVTRRREDIIKISGITAGQRTAWQAAAKAAGATLSSWVREAADAAALTGATAATLRGDLVTLRAELNRGVGNNLNQLARTLNIARKEGRAIDPADHTAALKAAAADLAGLRRQMDTLLRRLERRGRKLTRLGGGG